MNSENYLSYKRAVSSCEPTVSQMNLFLINFYCCLPLHIFEIDISHETWFLVLKILSPVSLSAFKLVTLQMEKSGSNISQSTACEKLLYFAPKSLPIKGQTQII